MDKRSKRMRRAMKNRAKIRLSGEHRLCVHRTPRHIYAQVIAPEGGKVVAVASTVEPTLRKELASTGNVGAATRVGQLIAERATSSGIKKVAFDRSGFRYHGRVKALADAAREGGLEF